MECTVERIPADAWKAMSEDAHKVAFGTIRDASQERIDFALLVKRGHQLMGYVTCKELDGRSLYWQFGGAFPGTKESSLTYSGYQAFIDWTKQHYDRVSTLVENDNIVMLKMAMKVGYRIVGIRNFKGHILCEMLLEFDNAQV